MATSTTEKAINEKYFILSDTAPDTMCAEAATNTIWKRNFAWSGRAVHASALKIPEYCPATAGLLSSPVSIHPVEPMKNEPSLNMRPNPISQKVRLAMEKMTMFFAKIFTVFFDLHRPDSSIPKPAFITKTRTAESMTQTVSSAIFISPICSIEDISVNLPPLLICLLLYVFFYIETFFMTPTAYVDRVCRKKFYVRVPLNVSFVAVNA